MVMKQIIFKLRGKNKPSEDFMEIGSSPIPGVILRHVFRGHKGTISRLSWAPDGRYLASSSRDKTIRIWDIEESNCVAVLQGNKGASDGLAWSPDGTRLATSYASEIRLWNTENWSSLSDIKIGNINALGIGNINSILWKPKPYIVCQTDFQIIVLDEVTYDIKKRFGTNIMIGTAWSMCWPRIGSILAFSAGKSINLWDVNNEEIIGTLIGHEDRVTSITWYPNEELLVSASLDTTIRIWNVRTHKEIATLEGHSGVVTWVGLSPNGEFIVSKSQDGSVRFWRSDTWEPMGELVESTGWQSLFFASLDFHPLKSILASLGNQDHVIRIWEIDYERLLRNMPITKSVRYTTAKLVLVGDSGVGKTGLGWRLAHNEFKEHSSTHGQQFWVVPELKKTREDGTECEAVLWDLAGQHIYRSIHSIFLDDVDASLVLFDPTNRQEPLKGAQFWLEQLKGKKQLPPSVLVGARLDRGAPVLSQQELDQFCQKYGISSGYIGTSAKSGEGLDKLVETLKDQIPWEQMTTTVTTVTFKKIKEYVLSLKEKTDRKGVLVHPDELRKQLQTTDRDWQFADAEMMTAVGHLANHGYVSVLHSSSGEEFILLVPELLASVAASIFLHADKHPRELGAINETELLQGKYPIEEFKGLEKEEQQVLLDATVVRFLEHSLCFRETLGNDNLLIFPSLIKQKRPLKDDVPATDDISYIVRGRVENIYAMMVVLLGYTPSFNRINQWQNQAQYETREGNICGFRMVEDREGEIELVLYHGEKMSRIEQREFQVLFERFLYQRDVEVQPVPPVRCLNGHLQERATVIKRQREGKKVIFCSDCGEQINLPNLAEMQTIGTSASKWLEGAESIARLRSTYEAHLSRIKGYRRDWAIPRCYISCISEQTEWKGKLVDDLGKAGVFVVEKTNQVQSDDFVILLDTKAYQQAWRKGDKALEDDFKLINNRLSFGKHKLISIAMEGMPVRLHDIQNCQRGNFCDESHYPVSLFDLVLNLYAIPLTHAGFVPLRQSLHQQWERNYKENQSIPDNGENGKPAPPSGQEIFISYAWGGESEKLVNELDKAFQNRGVTMVRDKRDLGFKGSIKGFMETIGKGKAVILVISEKYLKSENCMFELLQVAKHGDFAARIFPVVLRDANIYKAKDRVVYLQYWQQQIDELDTAIKSGGSIANIQGIQDDLNLYTEVRANIARLTDILKDMNTLTPEMHEDSGFSVIFDAVMTKLEE